MRIIIYTGKGGVGKTSVAAATACRLAAEGKKVMIMSTDQAHSLSDSFEIKCGREPVTVTENLDALEIDTIYESEKSWSNFKDYMKKILTMHGDGGIEVEELLVFPGLEEMFSMFRIMDCAQEGKYDVIIVDCAPTGETLSLLKYPEKLSGFIRKVLPIKRMGVKVAGPAVEKLMKMPMPQDSVFDDFEYIVDKMEQLQKLLLNKEVVSIRIVTTPEQIVINEAKRNFTCMHLFDYNVDAIIVNKIYPESAMEGYFCKWQEMQNKGLQKIREDFSEIPKFYLELQKNQVSSVPMLQEIGQILYGNTEPMDVLFQHKIYELTDTETQHSIRVYLPFAEKADLKLERVEEEIVLSYKNETRRYPLPVKWEAYEIQGAKLQQDYLNIIFA